MKLSHGKLSLQLRKDRCVGIVTIFCDGVIIVQLVAAGWQGTRTMLGSLICDRTSTIFDR